VGKGCFILNFTLLSPHLMTCFFFRLLQVSQMPHTFSIPFSDFSLAFRAQGIILYRLVFDISSKRQRATSGWSLFLIWSTLKIWVVEVWGVSFFFLVDQVFYSCNRVVWAVGWWILPWYLSLLLKIGRTHVFITLGWDHFHFFEN